MVRQQTTINPTSTRTTFEGLVPDLPFLTPNESLDPDSDDESSHIHITSLLRPRDPTSCGQPRVLFRNGAVSTPAMKVAQFGNAAAVVPGNCRAPSACFLSRDDRLREGHRWAPARAKRNKQLDGLGQGMLLPSNEFLGLQETNRRRDVSAEGKDMGEMSPCRF